MTRDEFAATVRRAEEHARSSPSGYRGRVAALGVLGYLYVGGLVVLALGLVVGLAMAVVGLGSGYVGARLLRELALPVLIFVWILLKALWITIDPPGGRRLTREEFPELFRMLDEIRGELRGPAIHGVRLNRDFNASIMQVPRLGILGFHRNYLVIGLPLLQALSPEEFRAVMAHEYGHLSGAHGKIGTWTYRIRATWQRLRLAFHEKKGMGTALIQRFFDWYAPTFAAYSFVLARENEFEADACAARVAGADHQADALIRITTLASYLDRDFWPGVLEGADDAPEPDADPFHQLAITPGLGLTPGGAESYLAQALEVPTDLADTHPSLADRLAAIGREPRTPPPVERSAAAALLGDRLSPLLDAFDDEWKADAGGWWRARHDHVAQGRRRLRELEEVGDEADGATLLEKARLLDQLASREEALPVYRAALDRDPDLALARCVVGFEQLAAGDEEGGLEMMERAMEADEGLVVDGCAALRDHYAVRGRMEDAHRYHDRLVEHQVRTDAIVQERYRIPFEKVYRPHDLSEETVAAVRAAVEADAVADRAWLVLKPRPEPEAPLYVLVVKGGLRLALPKARAGMAQRVFERLDVAADITVVNAEGDNRKLLRYVRKVPAARIV